MSTCGAYILRFRSGFFYVGSTDNFARRRMEHEGGFNRSNHVNRRLLDAYLDSGAYSFDWSPTDDRESAYRLEQALINEHRNNPLLLNFEKIVAVRDSAVSAKISETLMGHAVTDETRRKIGEARKGNQDWLGRTHSDSSKLKMSESQRGNTNAKGHVVSAECREKIRQTHLGRKHSDEARLKVSLNSTAVKRISIDGVEYRSITEAAKATNVKHDTIRRRCMDARPEWSGYRFISKEDEL